MQYIYSIESNNFFSAYVRDTELMAGVREAMARTELPNKLTNFDMYR